LIKDDTRRSIRAGCSDGQNKADQFAGQLGLKLQEGVSPETASLLPVEPDYREMMISTDAINIPIGKVRKMSIASRGAQ
jgi:hypothetical protein